MVNAPGPAPWYPPRGMPPGHGGAPFVHPLAKRFNVLGTVSLVLACLELCYGLWKLASAALTGLFLQLERALLGSITLPGPMPAPLTGMLAAIEDFTRKIALWEAARALPFMVASTFLIFIALRIRKGERQALFTARAWVWWALGLVAFSALLQVFTTIPATIDYQRQISGLMPTAPTAGRGAAPFDVKQFTDTWMLATTLMGLIGGTCFLAAWPIVLRVWADKLIAQSAPPS
ncbi:MAG: hypothetical protein ABI193_16030 [Minicystis sp.]